MNKTNRHGMHAAGVTFVLPAASNAATDSVVNKAYVRMYVRYQLSVLCDDIDVALAPRAILFSPSFSSIIFILLCRIVSLIKGKV